MRVLQQIVKKAMVRVDGGVIGKIDYGLLLYIGFTHTDREEDLSYFVDKALHLRIFPDDKMKMNRSLIQVEGEVLIVPQFTLYGNCLKGRRPSFIDSMDPQVAEKLYEAFIRQVRLKLGEKRVSTGQFGAHMEIESINIGPVNFLLQ